MKPYRTLAVAAGLLALVGCEREPAELFSAEGGPYTSEDRAAFVTISGEAVMYSHESVLGGLSCASGPVGDGVVPGLTAVRLGDEISLDGRTIRVGLIEVTRFERDTPGPARGSVLARKGDVVCTIAADQASLPSEDDCEALWIRAEGCTPG